jgi:hypothetical protein
MREWFTSWADEDFFTLLSLKSACILLLFSYQLSEDLLDRNKRDSAWGDCACISSFHSLLSLIEMVAGSLQIRLNNI